MESPLPAWLGLQCQMIAGAEAGLVVVGASEHAPGAQVAQWPPGETRNAPLGTAVQAARERGALVIETPAADAPPGATAQVAVPLLREGSVAGAFGVSVRGVPPAETKALAGLLGFGAYGLAQLLEAHAGRERLAARLSLAGSVLDHASLAGAGHALASEGVQRIGCERVAVGMERGGRLQLVALSSSARFTPESDSAVDLLAAMAEAVEQDAVIELPAPAEAPQRGVSAHEHLLRSTGAGAVCTSPLAVRGRPVGALTCEWRAGARPDARARQAVDDAALLSGPILELLARADAGVIARGKTALARSAERLFGPQRALAKAAAATVLGLGVLLAVVPGTYRVTAKATLEGRVQRVLVAGVDGYIQEAHARAGDVVQAGQVLAQLDDRDLRLEHRKRESEMAQLQKEYRDALAVRDRTQVSILRAQMDQAAAGLALAEERLGRTQVVAPFTGIVLEGDLDRALGSPVELGSALFQLAPLDGYRIIVEVDDRDIAELGVGQRGRLALSALPGRPFPLIVERITPVSTVEDGRSYFRVEAALEEPSDALRPGMEGIAKIEIGQRRLLWIWTHGWVDWLRLSTWSFLP